MSKAPEKRIEGRVQFSRGVAVRIVAIDGTWARECTMLDVAERLEESREAYTRAVELDPEEHNYVANVGEVLEQLGRHDEARAMFERAFDMARAELGDAPDEDPVTGGDDA